MTFARFFLYRPVTTGLLMAAILVFGALSFSLLPIDLVPPTDSPTIEVNAGLPGADPETMSATVATPLERQFATIAGIRSMHSSSTAGGTRITLQFDLRRNIDSAAQDVQTAISAALPLLPPMPSRPSLHKSGSIDPAILSLTMSSGVLPLTRVRELAERLGRRMAMVDGVALVDVDGPKYAVRVFVDAERLLALGVGLDEVREAIRASNVKLATGTLNGPHETFKVQTNDQLANAAAFRQLVVVSHGAAAVRLGDVARVEDGVENDRSAVWTRSGATVEIEVRRQPNSNIVQIVDRIREMLPGMQAELPADVRLDVKFDYAHFIRESVYHFELTLLGTVGLVTLVIFAFLRNWRATIIASLAIPVSIVGTFACMKLLDYSLNGLTLGGLTLAVGFVVDDAIVVLENVVRRLEGGQLVFQAAAEGTGEVSLTVVATTLSLVAALIPLLFLQGLLGRLVNPAAMTLAASVLLSAVVSLTLTPMLCSKLLRIEPAREEHRMGHLGRGYAWILGAALRHRAVTLALSVAMVGASVWLLGVCRTGLLPAIDSGRLIIRTQFPQDSSFPSRLCHQRVLTDMLAVDPNIEDYLSDVYTVPAGRIVLTLKPREQRSLGVDEVVDSLRSKLGSVPGVKVYVENPRLLNADSQNTNAEFQLSLQCADLGKLYRSIQELLARMQRIAGVRDANADLLVSTRRARLQVDRDAAAARGLNLQAVDDALNDAYGTRSVSTIYQPDNEYAVLMEVARGSHQEPAALHGLYVRAGGGPLIPLSSCARVTTGLGPLVVNHLGQMPSATLSFNLQPGASLSDTGALIRQLAHRQLPAEVTASFQGNAEAFQSLEETLVPLLIVAILVIYIVLGILYESFIHPLTILSGLPSAGLGALLCLVITHRELDVFGLIGLIMLMGLVMKNAIMVVNYALDLRRRKACSAAVAIHEACLIRMRPIMMTTMVAFIGALPLLLTEIMRTLGLAILGGLLVSQLVTLFTTPVVYVYFDAWTARWRRPKVAPLRLATSAERPS